MGEPGTIAVNVEVERKAYASRADMLVEISGDSFFSGNTALKKAHELRDLVAALAHVGIEESRIQVVGIRAEVASGIITRSSSAVYRLRIEVPSLDSLANTVGAITSRKNARLTDLDWQYTGLEELHDEMLGEALRRAEQRAARICRELNHRNLGVHSLTEKLRDVSSTHALTLASAVVRHRAAMTKEDLGLEICHAKSVSLEVRVEYRVQPEHDATADRHN